MYLTLQRQYLQDAVTYIFRADDYIKAGNQHHAAGCIAKAIKKLNRANCGFESDAIMYGTGVIETDENGNIKNVGLSALLNEPEKE